MNYSITDLGCPWCCETKSKLEMDFLGLVGVPVEPPLLVSLDIYSSNVLKLNPASIYYLPGSGRYLGRQVGRQDGR